MSKSKKLFPFMEIRLLFIPAPAHLTAEDHTDRLRRHCEGVYSLNKQTEMAAVSVIASPLNAGVFRFIYYEMILW
jgi:hypothetical protein